jgi:hypothetical protein
MHYRIALERPQNNGLLNAHTLAAAYKTLVEVVAVEEGR